MIFTTIFPCCCSYHILGLNFFAVVEWRNLTDCSSLACPYCLFLTYDVTWQIAAAWKPYVKKIGLWKSIRSLARLYDAGMGMLIFIPIALFSWFPFVSTFQTRLMFNQAFSRGLEISLILAGNNPNTGVWMPSAIDCICIYMCLYSEEVFSLSRVVRPRALKSSLDIYVLVRQSILCIFGRNAYCYSDKCHSPRVFWLSEVQGV